MSVEKEEATEIIYYGLVMQELRKYDRFNKFVNMNYQIQTVPNPEEGRIDVVVIEEDLEHVRQRIAAEVKDTLDNSNNIVTAPANILDKLNGPG